MSNSLGIAAVTATLRNLLASGVAMDPELSDTTITLQTLDRARTGTDSANQLNVFLYQTMPNAAYRNLDPPQTRPGETASPVLALNLYYLLTAYGRDNDVQRPFSHQLLGRAMSILHDHPLLGREEIRLALAGNDVGDQLERIRFTLQPLSIDDAFRLWSGFQTQYRLSVAYEATVVLISSTRAAKTPAPVLTRGRDDSGIRSQANLDSQTAFVTAVEAPGGVFGAELGQTVTFQGLSLGGDVVRADFSNRRLGGPIALPAQAGATATSFSVVLDPAAAPWVAGPYTAEANIVTKPGTAEETKRSSRPVTILVVPKIQNPFPVQIAASNGEAVVMLDVVPAVARGQSISLLVGDREISGPAVNAPTSKVTFTVPQAVPGTYLLRLRVDGVDSLVVDVSVAPPVFLDRRLVIQ